MYSNFIELFRNDIMLIQYDSNNGILKNEWLKKVIPNDIAKSELQNWTIYYRRTKPRYLITSMSGGYIIIPEMQEWMAYYLHPIVRETVVKWAFILNSDLFSSFSMQKTVEVIENLEFKRKFFDQVQEHEAFIWLLE